MIEKPRDILEFFFREIKLKGKYEIDIKGNMAYIIPRDEERYYKPVIKIPDLDYLEILLMEYVDVINEFNRKNNIELEDYQGLSYIFNIILFNLSSNDAEDLNKFIEMRISFFKDTNLDNYNEPKKVFEYGDSAFYAQRQIESFGLETPYIMTFFMESKGKVFNLPIIRYGINSDGVCYLYAVQIGRGRDCDASNDNYKKAVNSVNQGVKEYRNISPSFVLIFAMFLKILNSNNINKIVIPDFLFNRYKKYYGGNTTSKSDDILSRMFHNMVTLVNRLDNQIDGFNIQSYPFDRDSCYHIEIVNLKSENKMLKKLLSDET